MGKILAFVLCLFAAFITIEAIANMNCHACHCPGCLVDFSGSEEESYSFMLYIQTTSSTCHDSNCDDLCDIECKAQYSGLTYQNDDPKTSCNTIYGWTDPATSCGWGQCDPNKACPSISKVFDSSDADSSEGKRSLRNSTESRPAQVRVPVQQEEAPVKRNAEGNFAPVLYYDGIPIYNEECPEYLGCYTDESDRDLNGPSKDPVTGIEDCIRYCSGVGMTYAGIQDGIQCYCADRYGTYGKDANACVSNCTGPLKRSILETMAALNGTSNSTQTNTTTHTNSSTTTGNTTAHGNFTTIKHYNGTHSNTSYNCGGSWANAVWTTGLMGCWKDSTSARDLPYVYATTDSTMTVTKCRNGCHNAGYIFAGLQAGEACYCGQGYGSYGQDASLCYYACYGDYTQNCGGSLASIVFTSLEFPPA